MKISTKEVNKLLDDLSDEYDHLSHSTEELQSQHLDLFERVEQFSEKVAEFDEETNELCDRLGESPIIDFRDDLMESLEHLTEKFEMGLDHFHHSQKLKFDFVFEFREDFENACIDISATKSEKKRLEFLEGLKLHWERIKKAYESIRFEFNERSAEIEEMVTLFNSAHN